MENGMKRQSEIKRRQFLKGSTLAAGAAVASAAAVSSFPKPALSQGKMEWRMVTSWPKGLPGVGTGAERLAERIGKLSDGRLTIKVYAAGELVPALECFAAVSNGTAEMAHDASYYHLGKHRCAAFFTSVPFGLTAPEMTAWVNYGGGQEVWDELYAQFGIKPFQAGNTGCQALGWYRKEIKSVADYKGLKKRMPGLGGEVLKKLGGVVVNLPGGEIFQALQSGAVDAAEWIGPYNDLTFGFYQVAKYYYSPGFQEPGSVLESMVNKAKYDALPNDLKEIIKVASQASHDDMLAEYNMRNGPALETLTAKHGVNAIRPPNDVLIAFGNASGEVLAEERDKTDAIGKKIFESYLAARKLLIPQTRFLDQALVNARALAYKYID